MKKISFFENVYEAVKKIPYGKVATYGQIALMCSNPKASRAVGYALHVNPDPKTIPCHRVVNRFGRLSPAFAFGGIAMHAQLLEKEGVRTRDGYVDLSKYLWDNKSEADSEAH